MGFGEGAPGFEERGGFVVIVDIFGKRGSRGLDGHGTSQRPDFAAEGGEEVRGVAVCAVDDVGGEQGTARGVEGVRIFWVGRGSRRDAGDWSLGFEEEACWVSG